MSGPVSNSMTRNPAYSPYAIDDPVEFSDELSNKGLTNPAYENCPADQDPSHHYENPSQLQTNTGRRQKQSPIYESAAPRPTPTKYQKEPVETYKESKLNFIILSVILVISIVALVLVVLIIVGKLGPACSCASSKASPQTAKLEEASSISLVPLYTEINALNQNFSTLSSQLNQKITTLQSELNDAQRQIQLLQGSKNAIDIAAVWTLANTTKDELQSEAIRLQKVINDTIDKCNAGDVQLNSSLEAQKTKEQNDITTLTTRIQNQKTEEQNDVTTLQKAINDTIDKCIAGDAQLLTKIQNQETKEKNDVRMLQKATNDSIDKCMNVNSTLTTRLQTQETKEQNDVTTLTTRIQTQETKETNDVTTLQNGINDAINKCKNVNSTLLAKIDAVSKMQGPRGYNGSQGASGLQGPSGAGNLTQCMVDKKEGSHASGPAVSFSVNVEELPGKKIVHFSCSSNNADSVEQGSRVLSNGHKEYLCYCHGMGRPASGTTKCYLWYTVCPLIS